MSDRVLAAVLLALPLSSWSAPAADYGNRCPPNPRTTLG